MATFIGAIDIMETDYLLDEVFSSYFEVCIRINAHTYSIEHKIETLRP